MLRGSIGVPKYICHLYLLPYSLTALVFIVLLIFRLTDREHVADAWRAPAHPAYQAVGLTGLFELRNKSYWTKAYRLKCSMHQYIIFPGNSCLGLEMGRYQFFLQN